MVRPNQIIESDVENGELTFILFARNEEQVKRRVLWINFPQTIRRTLFGDESVDDFVKRVQQVTTGKVNRYAVTIDTRKVSQDA